MPDRRMLDLCLSHAVVESDDPLPFSCRGCGNYCCGDLGATVHIMPPEYFRMRWFLDRNPQVARRLRGLDPFVLDKDYAGGLPLMMLNVRPVYWQGGYLKACPFLAEEGEDGDLLVCLVHTARPHACRLFPVGETLDARNDRGEARGTYRMMAYCPGFETPGGESETVAGYEPAPIDQTVADWVRSQTHVEQHAEYVFHFFEVMLTYFRQGWRLAGSGAAAQGSLTRAAYEKLAPLFYPDLPPPQDPDDDHAFIMDYLSRLRDDAQEIVRQVMFNGF